MKGSLHIPGAAPASLRGRIVLHDEAGNIPLDICQDRYRAPGLELQATARPIDSGTELTLQLRMEPDRTIDFLALDIGSFPLAKSDSFFCEVPGFLEKSGAVPAQTAQEEQRESVLFAMLARPGQTSCLMGIAAIHATGSSFVLRHDHLRARFHPYGDPPAGIHTFKLFIGFDHDPLALLRRYGAHLAHLGRAQRGTLPTGWNSWDFYGGAIRMADIHREIEALNALKCRDQLQYLTLDMGWEEAWGNWVPNRRFPETFRAIATIIRQAGWRPGIWTAPLQVGLFTPLARHRQDLFLRDADGSLIILEDDMPCGPALLLDVTRPEVQAEITRWYTAMREAGFELFKIDYLYNRFLSLATNAAGGGDKVAFARTLLRTIREAVGDDAHIINCGGNKEAALGLVDSSRVSMDIHNFWGHIRNNSRQIANCFWMNGPLWTNDPDFAILRSGSNCEAPYMNMPYSHGPLLADGDFWMRGPEASGHELRLWLSVVRLNGGSVFLSDSIASLSSDGRRELDRMFPPLDAGFDPLDLFDRRYPGIWLSRSQSRPTLGLFNWEETAQTLALPPLLGGTLSGRNFWDGTTTRINGEIRLNPRSGILLEL